MIKVSIIAVIVAFFWLALVGSGNAEDYTSSCLERGDTIFVGQNWYLKNTHPSSMSGSCDSLPFVPTDSMADSGIAWNRQVQISYDGAAHNPESEIHKGNVYALWFSSILRAEEVFTKFSADFGQSWTDSLVLSPLPSYDNFCNINGSDSLVFAVWVGGDWDATYFRKATIGTTNWSNLIIVREEIGVNEFCTSFFTYRPDITNSQTELYVTYEACDNAGFNQRFKKSTDLGETWIEERIVGGVSSGKGAEITYVDGVIHVIRTGGSLEVRYNRSIDGGATWSRDTILSQVDQYASQWASGTADPYGNVYVTWFDYKDSPYGGSGYLFYRRSTDRGETWEAIGYLSSEPLATWSDIWADSFGVYAVWENGPWNERAVHFRMSTDFGQSWSPEATLSEAGTNNWYPEIDSYGKYLSLSFKVIKSGAYLSVSHRLGGRYIPGDANGNQIVNVADAVYLIGYIFSGGPPPVIYKAGDVNCSNSVNITDVVYLIIYIFGGGSPPCSG